MTSEVTQAALEPGTLEHHSSEEEGPADVGVLLHINATDALWIGEITSKDAAAFSVREDGWHMVHHSAGGKTHIAFVPDGCPAIDLADVLAAAITRLTAQSGEGRSGAGEDIESLCTLLKALAVDCRYTDGWEDGEDTCKRAAETIASLAALNARLTAQSGDGRSGAIEAYLVERLEGEGYGPLRRIVDGRIHDPTSDAYWVNIGIKNRHRVTPLAALNARQSGEGGRLREVLVEHFPTGLRGLYEQSAQRIPVLTYVGTNCLCGWCTSATDEHEVREEWAAHVLAALRATDDAGGA